ncbi:MAG: NAD(P)/FAD-dependent oxidoreductase [Actinomycetota bacterium]|nr:NAD(P)/FAD-dependent oxidoreductase [Actinomycetota bacterium]
MATEHVDVLIIGAGVSGIGAACHLTRESAGRSYLILERRDAIGGTWDLFRYPGIRSDSDMLTFGYNFRPWNDTKVLADGPAIRGYVADTAAEYGVEKHIRFGRAAVCANWSSADGLWSVEARNSETGGTEAYTCNFLISAAGYYNYDEGYRPAFPGEEEFRGEVVHPQHWPERLNYRGKRVVVIGSGATAVTLVPAMAPDTAHITMLQRSPSYIVSLPGEDALSAAMRRVLPDTLVYRLSRWRNILLQRGIYRLAKSQPRLVRRLVQAGARRQLGPDFDMRHFTPKYDPWDQRLCVVPDGDLFKVLREGQASIVTGEIDRFTATGIRLKSGEELPADLIVAATGLQIRITGGNELLVDGVPVPLSEVVTYKGVLIEGVPNAAVLFGYTNASWTLKADIASEYVCRLLNHMQAHGYSQVVAQASEADRGGVSVLATLNSGYVRRADHALPRQGTRHPWVVLNDYVRDAPMLRYGAIEDGHLVFTAASTRQDRTEALVR